jgi:hypothetical protein
MDKDQVNKTGMEPDEMKRVRATDDPTAEDEADTEGHRRFVRVTGDDEEPADDQPTDPDTGRFSDRNLKIAVVPVVW